MTQLLLFLFQVLVAVVFISIFVICVVFIRPFRMNKKRPASTLYLKITYLVYLLIILSFFYYLFFQKKELYEVITNLRFFILLACLFIPNAGMLARRRMKDLRAPYNYLLGSIHVLVIFYLVRMFVIIERFPG